MTNAQLSNYTHYQNKKVCDILFIQHSYMMTNKNTLQVIRYKVTQNQRL